MLFIHTTGAEMMFSHSHTLCNVQIGVIRNFATSYTCPFVCVYETESEREREHKSKQFSSSHLKLHYCFMQPPNCIPEHCSWLVPLLSSVCSSYISQNLRIIHYSTLLIWNQLAKNFTYDWSHTMFVLVYCLTYFGWYNILQGHMC